MISIYIFCQCLDVWCVCLYTAGTLCATYNDLNSVKALFKANKGEISGVILEPVVGNSGFIKPTQEFLEVRKLGWSSLGDLTSAQLI